MGRPRTCQRHAPRRSEQLGARQVGEQEGSGEAVHVDLALHATSLVVRRGCRERGRWKRAARWGMTQPLAPELATSLSASATERSEAPARIQLVAERLRGASPPEPRGSNRTHARFPPRRGRSNPRRQLLGPERVLAAQVEGSESRALMELAHPCGSPGIGGSP